MGRVKLVGHEKCPRPDRKTGKPCNKQGRYNPKLRVTWNTKLRFDQHRKRQYRQFIHNDGTRHYISIGSNSNSSEDDAKETRLYNTVRKAALTTPFLLSLKPAQREEIIAQLKEGNIGPMTESFKQYDSARRKWIYEKRVLNDKRFREIQTYEFEEIDTLARKRLPSLSLSSSELEKRFDELLLELGHDKMGHVVKRRLELTTAQIRRLNHEEEAIKEVWQKRGLGRFSA